MNKHKITHVRLDDSHEIHFSGRYGPRDGLMSFKVGFKVRDKTECSARENTANQLREICEAFITMTGEAIAELLPPKEGEDIK